jgi:hypothetical protein
MITTYKNKELLNETFQNAELPKIRNEFIAKLENALMFLDYKDLNMWHSEAKSQINLNTFDGAWMIDTSLRHDEKDMFVFAPFGDLQVTPDMFPNLNMKTLNLSSDVGYLSKIRFLETKEKRHLQNYKHIFSHRVGFLDYGKQKWWTDEQGYGFDKIKDNMIIPYPTPLKSGYFYNANDIIKEMEEGAKDDESMYRQTIKALHMALQLSLTYYYEWSCYIKETPQSLGVRIPIHPSSSKEIFIMRNVPEGKERKSAIVNFVKNHYRTIKGYNDNEREVLVKQHLRGDLKFNWRGLEVHITPSQYDINKLGSGKKFLNLDNN